MTADVRACGRAVAVGIALTHAARAARVTRAATPAHYARTPAQREDWKKHKGVCKALAAAAATAAPAEHGPEEGSEAFEAPARTAVSARALRTAVSARALFDVDVDVPAISR